jgi:hypothetical protein
MANVSSVRLTYELPQKGTRHTVPMVPIVNYLGGFGAKVPFTETGAWRLDIQVVRTGGGSGSRNRSGQLLRRQTITSFRHQLYFEIVNGNPNST